MSFAAASRLAQTLLYEGYALYPYRGSSLKNRKRWALGTLYPLSFCEVESEHSSAGIEVLVRGSDARVRVVARFLHPISRRTESEPGAGNSAAAVWFEAREAEATWGPLSLAHLTQAQRKPFHLPGDCWSREDASYAQQEINGYLEVSASDATASQVRRLRVDLHNVTAPELASRDRDEAYAYSLASAHLLLDCEGGVFVSQLEPPEELAALSADCRQRGLFPVLVGSKETSRTLLCSPVILYDQPQLAPESPGDLFDATEIDEILTLRILTLTEAEKLEAARTDPRVRQLLERTHALNADQLAALHGAERATLITPRAGAPQFALGQRVRLNPGRGGDVFDLALRGEIATIRAVEESLDGGLFFAVTVDADPAAALGMGDLVGHRFYFRSNELEALS